MKLLEALKPQRASFIAVVVSVWLENFSRIHLNGSNWT